jgi:VanZ family protein
MRIQQSTLFLQLAFFALLILAMTFITIPGHTILADELQNSGHTLVFGVSALISLRLLRTTTWIKRNHVGNQYLAVFILCLIAGIAVELLQSVTGGDADIYDVVRDIAGIVAFLGFYALIDREITTSLKGNKRRVLTSTTLISVLVLGLALYPLSRLACFYYERHEAFPVIIDFSSAWFNDFVSTKNAELVVVTAPEEWAQEAGKLVARITLKPAKYPGFHIDEPAPDWTGYSNLNLKIFSTNRDEFTLVIRIHDRQHNQQFNDRFNYRLNIKPGQNIVRIGLQSVLAAPAHREMNMQEIAGVVLFAVEPKKPLEFYLSDIWLD